MTAGSIAVPTVIPLRPPLPGRPKTSIDSNTKIELRTETPGTDIYYTINGWKPEPFKKTGEKCTMKYVGPFTLPAGKQTVKALAVSSDGMRESNVVTKIFDVDYVPAAALPVEDDDHGFQDDLNRSRAKREIDKAKARLIPSAGSAWTNVEELKSAQQRLTESEMRSSANHKPYPAVQFVEPRQESMRDARHTTSMPQPYIFNGIGSQDLRWATDNQIYYDQMKYPRASDFINFATTSAGQYPGRTQFLPVNVSPGGFIVPFSQGAPGVADGIIRSRKPSHNVSTQTVGLFYPSQKQLHINREQEDDRMILEKQMRDRRPLITAVSPGRGYWRKQIDHICQHLRVHTQNNAEFRALIGEPKMGKLLSSAIEQDGYELNLTLTFALRDSKDPPSDRHHGVSKSRSSNFNARSHQDNSMYSEDEESEEEDEEEEAEDESVTSRTTRRKRVRKAKPKKKIGTKLSPINVKLFKQLGSKNDASVSEIQQLLDEGADPNCLNKNEMSPLFVAVKNGHVDAIDVLVHNGADVNAKGPSAGRGNTALHEAVNKGPSSMKVIDALLLAGADQNVKNDKGETPHDLAVKAGYEAISKRLVSALGQAKLEKMTKPQITS